LIFGGESPRIDVAADLQQRQLLVDASKKCVLVRAPGVITIQSCFSRKSNMRVTRPRILDLISPLSTMS